MIDHGMGERDRERKRASERRRPQRRDVSLLFEHSHLAEIRCAQSATDTNDKRHFVLKSTNRLLVWAPFWPAGAAAIGNGMQASVSWPITFGDYNYTQLVSVKKNMNAFRLCTTSVSGVADIRGFIQPATDSTGRGLPYMKAWLITETFFRFFFLPPISFGLCPISGPP